MQPELPTPRINPEQAGQVPKQIERQPMPALPEFGPPRTPERAKQLSENASRAAEISANPSDVGLPTVVPMPTVDPATATGDDDVPSIAADEDLIEKEWVGKAKKIINATREDPAERERAVANLQAEYLKKRYGKELGSDN